MENPRLVLASTSRYRRELLARLGMPFEVVAPGVDEAALPGEAPAATALRLAEAKARAVAARIGDGLVVGSDQVADCDGAAIGKPGGHGAAVTLLPLFPLLLTLQALLYFHRPMVWSHTAWGSIGALGVLDGLLAVHQGLS